VSEKFLARWLGLAALLAALAFPAGAWAQDGGPAAALRRDQDGNGYAPELSSLGALTASLAIADPVCPDLLTTVRLSRPAATGDDLLDEILALELRKELRAAQKEEPAASSPSECPSAEAARQGAERVRVFEAHSPSPGILSVVYLSFASSPDMVHPYTSFESFTYSLSEGRELGLGDVLGGGFGQPAALWAKVAAKWCAYGGHRSLPAFYGLDDGAGYCDNPGGAPLPPALAADPGSLAALGNAYLTSQGLVLQLGAYDGWSYADGPSTLLIDKEEMIEAGADPAIWKR
jgi:hypothetical protein